MRSAGIYGFQWRENVEFERMVKSVGRKYVTLWSVGWQVKERIKSDNEERIRSREAGRGREAWIKVSKTDGRTVGNREEEARNSEEELWEEMRDCMLGEI